MGPPSFSSKLGISYLGPQMEVEKVEAIRSKVFFSGFCLASFEVQGFIFYFGDVMISFYFLGIGLVSLSTQLQ